MFIGVDGGGTKTAFILLDATAHVRATTEGGTTYHPEVGLAAVRETLARGVAELLKQAQIDAGAVRHAFFGLPAFGEDPAIDPELARIPEAFLAPAQFSCGNDMICGWAGALACEDGISVTAGTGSIAYGEYHGASARSGGWGEIFGDEGSAHWIGREGLAAFSRMSDGRAPAGPLQQALRAHFGLARDIDLAGRVNSPGFAARSTIAQLARVVAGAAEAGDAAARAVFERAGAELAALVHATRGELKVPRELPLPVSYSGGVFDTGHLILEPFTAHLREAALPYQLQTPLFPPSIGAALKAAHFRGARFTPDQLTALALSPNPEGPKR